MHYQHHQQKRKQRKRYLRLKVITNRQFNFMIAIRPDSTITDLANRALNVYLELNQLNTTTNEQFNSLSKHKTKKQLTVSAVKQGRYFMPKSQIVSNLLSQDEEVEIIIVKAKPKFPQQAIPTQHDYQILNKQVKNFDIEKINKKLVLGGVVGGGYNNTNRQNNHNNSVNKTKPNTNPTHQTIHKHTTTFTNKTQNHPMILRSSSMNNIQVPQQINQIQTSPKSYILPSLSSNSSQLQKSKRQRKRQKKLNKKKKIVGDNQIKLNNYLGNITAKNESNDNNVTPIINNASSTITNCKMDVERHSKIDEVSQDANMRSINQMQQQSSSLRQRIISNQQQIPHLNNKNKKQLNNSFDIVNDNAPQVMVQQTKQTFLPNQSKQQQSVLLNVVENNNIEKQQRQKSKSKSRQKGQIVQQQNNSGLNVSSQKKDFCQLLKLSQSNSQEKLDEQKKKFKIDPLSISISKSTHHHSTHNQLSLQQIPRKGSLDNRSQKTPKINSPIPSPKIIFHFQTKHQSPKVLYIPESKTISQLKQNIQKQKQKIKNGNMSPMILPRNSPKISFLAMQETLVGGGGVSSSGSKEELSGSGKNGLLNNSLTKKNKDNGIMNSNSTEKIGSLDLLNIPNGGSNSKQNQEKHHIQHALLGTTTKNDNSVNSKNTVISLDLIQEKPKPIHPHPSTIKIKHHHIIEEESSSSQSCQQQLIKNPTNNINKNHNHSKPITIRQQSGQSNNKRSQNSDTIKKKSTSSNKFYEIDMLINKFKLQESDDENGK